jgi:hypothetical protein
MGNGNNDHFNPNRQEHNKAVKKAIKEHQKETKRQMEEVYQKNKEYIEKQLDTGKVDWALYSLVLGRIDFSDCANSEDVIKKFYAAIFPYMGKLIRDNYNAKALMAKLSETADELSTEDTILFNELIENESDPLQMSHKVLNDEKKVARKRAKSPLVLPGTKAYGKTKTKLNLV